MPNDLVIPEYFYRGSSLPAFGSTLPTHNQHTQSINSPSNRDKLSTKDVIKGSQMRCFLRLCSLALTISLFTACASKNIDPTAQIPVEPLSKLTVEAEQVQANPQVVAEVMKLWGAIKYLNIGRPDNIDAYLLELINLRLNTPDAYWQNVDQLFAGAEVESQASSSVPTALNWLTSNSNSEQKEHLAQQILTAHAAYGLGDDYVNWLPIPEPINEANYASDSLATRLIIAARIWSALNYLSPYRDYTFEKAFENAFDGSDDSSSTDQHENASFGARFGARFDSVLAQVLASDWLYNESNFEYELVNYIGGAMNDGHIMGGGSQPYCSYPLSTAWLENELYIVGERAEGAFDHLGLTSGQVISHINGKTTADFLAQRTTPASNLAYRQWRNSSRKFNRVNCEQNMTITVDSKQVELTPLPADKFAVWFSTLPQPKPIQMPDSIGYINLAGGTLSDEAWQALLSKPAIIIDNRRYPQLDTVEQAYHHLLWDLSLGWPQSLNLYRPIQSGFGEQELMQQPGTRQFEQGHSTANGEAQSYPSSAYQGKLYMLVDRYTKSMGETVALAFAEYSDITIVGEQTAGANGTVKQLPLSRGEIMYYSALGAYFLNGELHQMVGVPLDVEVSLSVEDYFSGRDGVEKPYNSLTQFQQGAN